MYTYIKIENKDLPKYILDIMYRYGLRNVKSRYIVSNYNQSNINEYRLGYSKNNVILTIFHAKGSDYFVLYPSRNYDTIKDIEHYEFDLNDYERVFSIMDKELGLNVVFSLELLELNSPDDIPNLEQDNDYIGLIKMFGDSYKSLTPKHLHDIIVSSGLYHIDKMIMDDDIIYTVDINKHKPEFTFDLVKGEFETNVDMFSDRYSELDLSTDYFDELTSKYGNEFFIVRVDKQINI